MTATNRNNRNPQQEDLMNRKKTTFTLLGIIAFLTITTAAMAGWGRGAGRMGGGYAQWGGCPYAGAANGNLSAEELEKMNADRLAFFNETDALRRSLHQKSLALRSELAKEKPDAEKAASLQGDISNLRSEMSQKRLAYQLKAGGTGTEAWCGQGGRGGRGGRGGMQGYGPRGGRGGMQGYGQRGGCW
jgi:zinc resistance-associated protein